MYLPAVSLGRMIFTTCRGREQGLGTPEAPHCSHQTAGGQGTKMLTLGCRTRSLGTWVTLFSGPSDPGFKGGGIGGVVSRSHLGPGLQGRGCHGGREAPSLSGQLKAAPGPLLPARLTCPRFIPK